MQRTRIQRSGNRCGLTVVVFLLLASRSQAVDPPTVVLGHNGTPAGRVITGYRAPVFTASQSPVAIGNGAAMVLRNAAPSVPGYVANYSVPTTVPAPMPVVVGYGGSYAAPVVASPAPAVARPAPARAQFYNPVGFGFGGYSYGEYPAYGFNGYLPAAYDGFNVSGYASRAVTTGYRGAASPGPGGYSTFNMSDAWTGYCGPHGCRMGYRAW